MQLPYNYKLLIHSYEYNSKNISKDSDGNLLVIDLQLSEISLRIVNIYGPNEDNPNFFLKVNEFIEDSNETYVLICGDFNLTLNPSLDCYNYININNHQSRSTILDAISSYQLTDVFRYFHPDTKRFTWRRKNPIKQAHLDFYLTSSSMVDIILSCNIKPSYRSDHSAVEIIIILDDFKKGKGTWKLNCSLLKNKEYLEQVNNLINELKSENAVPVYNRDNLNNILDSNI